jgi:SNF2 family DNA or RNA helicase
VQAIGREKLDALLEWLNTRWDEDPALKVLIWCRFRAELLRIRDALPKGMPVGVLLGSQRKQEREDALRLFDPRTAPDGRAVLLGTTKTGQTGLNLTAAHTVVYASNDTSLFTRMQSEDRVHRPGQRNVVSYFDVVATGPAGQRTVDHVILKALREKQNLATWTTSAWVAELTRE